MSTTIYSVNIGEDGETFFPNRKQAIDAAREAHAHDGSAIAVTQILVANMPRRLLYCALANNREFAAEQTEIWSRGFGEDRG